MAGQLIVAATPIGNLDDVSPRLTAALQRADVIYAEDTRRTRNLLRRLDVNAPVRSYFVGNEASRAKELGGRLADGDVALLVTDAGMPGISDPGYSAVRAALDAEAEVTVVPGPSAVTAALAVSGLPVDRFVFDGFLPRRGKARTERLAELTAETRTMVLFASKDRLVGDLIDLAEVLGADRRCVIARELSKAHEQVWRGSLGDAQGFWTNVEPRGEFTLVIEGGEEAAVSLSSAVDECLALVSEGVRTSEAVRRVATDSGLNRRSLYEAVLQRGR